MTADNTEDIVDGSAQAGGSEAEAEGGPESGGGAISGAITGGIIGGIVGGIVGGIIGGTGSTSERHESSGEAGRDEPTIFTGPRYEPGGGEGGAASDE